MCAGETIHFVNGQRIILRQGELLFLNQQARHAVSRAGKEDIAVNFIVLPDFFTTILPALGEEETPLRRFLVDCLCGETKGTAYLHFHVSDLPAVQNLVENLLFALLEDTPNRRKISQNPSKDRQDLYPVGSGKTAGPGSVFAAEHGPERGRHCQRRGLRKSGLLSPHFPGGLRLLPTGIPSANQVTFLDKSRPPFHPAAVVN